ncbi:MAG: HEAT repeat domain-containing protein, partial [Bacteroidales bacterium]
MNCKDIIRNMEAYLLEKLPEKKRIAVDAHLRSCQDCKTRLDQSGNLEGAIADIPVERPDETLRSGFVAFIENEKRRIRFDRAGFIRSFWRRTLPVTVAASVAFFVIGFFSGKTITRDRVAEEELVALRKEVRQTKNLMILSMLKQPSASKRIAAVNYAEELDILEPELREALFKSLNNDKSENVRLAALEALSRYAGVPEIREELLNSFELQTDPIIQISLINLMVNMNEKSSIPLLQKLVDDEMTYEMV